MTTDIYLQPNLPDPILEPDYVLSLVRRHAPAREVRKVEESGGEARAYMVDDGIILKVQRPHRLRPRTSLEKEGFFLNQLAPYAEICVPRVLGYGRDAEVEYICMTRMEGVASLNVGLSSEERRSMLGALGRTLRRLHSVNQEPFRNSPLLPGDRSIEDLRARLQALLQQAVTAAHAEPSLWTLAMKPEVMAKRIMERMPKSASLIVLHSNPGPEHVFLDPLTKQFTGLIDFGDAYISHPGFDIRWPRPEDRAAIMAGYQAEAALDDDSLETWRTVYMISEMTASMASRSSSERKSQARKNLAEMAAQL